MAGNILDFNTLPELNPATPPSGYTKPAGADAARIGTIGSFKLFYLSGAAQAIWYDNLSLTGTVISAKGVLPVTVSSSAVGVCLIDASGNGLMVLTSTSTNNFRIFAVANGQLSGSALMTASVTPLSNAEIELRKTNNDYEVFQNGIKVGTTYTTASYTPTFAGAVSRGGQLRSLESEYIAAFTLDTLTDPLVAGSAFSGTCTGFADGAATLSSNGLSVAVTIASGAFSGTWPQAVDAQPYPTLPKTAQTITLTQGADTATITSDLELPAGMEVVNLVSPITNDDTYLGYYFEQDGFTAEGAQFVFTPYSDLTMAADGGVEVTGEGNLIGYFIPATGTGAGNAYYYTFQISDGGAVVSGGRPLTSVGLTSSGLTSLGLTSVGL
jgi:hypothetical protein